MRAYFNRFFLAVVWLLTMWLPLHGQAEPFFTNKKGNLIFDKATGLVWQRCSLGQVWDGKTCSGGAEKFNFVETQKLANDGWRVPTVRELISLVYCSNGPAQMSRDPKDGGPLISNGCVKGHSKPTINTIAFPGTPSKLFWSSSTLPVVAGSERAWTVDFDDGYIFEYSFYNYEPAVRVVRTSQLSGSEAALEFPISMDDIVRLEEAKRQEEQRIADLKRQEEERRTKAQRAAAERSLAALGPQALYLQAGKAQRNGSIEQGGVNFYASELYELIVEKFPKSEFAVKATDQLNALDRTERQGQAARQAAERQAEALRDADRNASNRAACFSEVNSCVAKCRSLGMNYDSTQYCVNNCQKTCN